MRQAVDDVRTFMTIAGQTVRSSPEIPLEPEMAATLRNTGGSVKMLSDHLKQYTTSEKAFRLRLILSEAAELAVALANDDEAEVADALADIDYVTIGTALQFGMPHEAVWRAVQMANLAKFPVCPDCKGVGVVVRADLLKMSMDGLFGKSWLIAPKEGTEVEVEFLTEAEADDFLAKQKKPCPGACRGTGQIVLKDAQGKVHKPEGWRPPDISAVLDVHRVD